MYSKLLTGALKQRPTMNADPVARLQFWQCHVRVPSDLVFDGFAEA